MATLRSPVVPTSYLAPGYGGPGEGVRSTGFNPWTGTPGPAPTLPSQTAPVVPAPLPPPRPQDFGVAPLPPPRPAGLGTPPGGQPAQAGGLWGALQALFQGGQGGQGQGMTGMLANRGVGVGISGDNR
jgi:hypothetical protein